MKILIKNYSIGAAGTTDLISNFSNINKISMEFYSTHSLRSLSKKELKMIFLSPLYQFLFDFHKLNDLYGKGIVWRESALSNLILFSRQNQINEICSEDMRK